ncbi:LuxR C-terminal-related transcriptional regulator [Nocardioides daeguensis]|uniref:Response regulator transcription factor n=1 Tax=Nocardioides daeguensis TaxID=908359 RepID=A0ABP6WB64_9ACTN|nr:response regulator transcription factor [Nocardioides daeguensis]MBV6728087.1 response regulator transcription factor [Nocardioides daeguensis]MCR1774161.1 response regulator transcription factor [Nocardioides daeguensis]
MSLSREQSRITVLDRHELFAETLHLALTNAGHQVQRMSPPEPAASPARLVEAVRRSRPHVLLLDPDLGDVDGAEVIRTLGRCGVVVVVLTAEIDRARWGGWLFLGARAVLSKSVTLTELSAALRAIGEGREVLSREERNRLVELHHREHHQILECRARLDALTQREREVLTHLIYGDTVSDIAHADVVSEATVRTQVKSILAKLGVTSQIGAVSVAFRARWRPAHPVRTALS